MSLFVTFALRGVMSQQQNRLTVLVTAIWDHMPCYGITQSRLADAICQN